MFVLNVKDQIKQQQTESSRSKRDRNESEEISDHYCEEYEVREIYKRKKIFPHTDLSYIKSI